MVDPDRKYSLHLLRNPWRRCRYSKQATFHDISALRTSAFLAFLSRKDNIHWHWCASWGQSISHISYLFIHIPLTQAVRDVFASYEALVNLFERIQFFLQRLHYYTSVPITPEMTELLAKIMAQILSILALSTKTMNEWRISWSIQLMYSYVANCSSRNIYEETYRKD